MAELVIDHLVKRFGAFTALKDFSLHVRDGEFVSFLGPSGCGKSTTLAAIAGLDRPSEGSIRIGARTFYDGAKGIFLPPEARGCGLVFQSYALWPHMTVAKNLSFPLKLRRVPKAEQTRRIAQALDLVEMGPYADRFPHELSGGQQQRVALARTLVYNPEILLLDEPLSNLDAKLRDRARIWLAELRDKLRMTTIYVTHDQVEALSLSDRIVVMNKGEIAQIGTPQEIYENPTDAFVADFIGTTNFLAGVAAGGAGRMHLQFPDGQTLGLPASARAVAGQPATLALRPNQLLTGDGPGTLLRARVMGQAYVGGRWQVSIDIGGNAVRLEVEDRLEADTLTIRVPDGAGAVFRASADALAPVTAGAA
jgi:iron(III) transport system ATP-binding protein